MNTPEGKIFRFVRPVAPEIFDRVAFERELKKQFAWENSVLKVKIDQNENFQITRHS